MSNMMLGDNSGAEPREHHPECASLCYWIDHNWASAELMEGCKCPEDHSDHDCTCDELHEQDAEREAEAYAAWLDVVDAFAAGAMVDGTLLVPFYDFEIDPALTETDEP